MTNRYNPLGECDVSPDVVLAELNRVLTSRIFAHAVRLSRFLKYGVECALAGRPNVNEYAIGVDVFGRGPSFDPRIDPIVRVDARRLRSKLTEYYDNEGAADPLEICLPLRTYIPVFRIRAAQPAPDPVGEEWRVPGPLRSVLVIPFTNLNNDQEDRFFADGLTEELIHALVTRTDLRVVAGEAAHGRSRHDRTDPLRNPPSDATVRGTVRRAPSGIRVSAEISSIPDRIVLWSHIFQESADNVVPTQTRIAAAVCDALLELTEAAEDSTKRLSAMGS